MNLITLEEFKSYQSIPVNNDKEDAKINILIESVSALIQTYLNIDGEGGKSYTEIISLDYDTNKIYLEHYPVFTLDSVSETSRYTWDSSVHVPLSYGSDFSLDADQGILHRTHRIGGFANWPVSPGAITVTYTTASKWNSMYGSSVPADLKLAAISLVEYYRKEEYRQAKTIQGSSVVNTLAKGSDFPQHIQILLDKYKL